MNDDGYLQAQIMYDAMEKEVEERPKESEDDMDMEDIYMHCEELFEETNNRKPTSEELEELVKDFIGSRIDYVYESMRD